MQKKVILILGLLLFLPVVISAQTKNELTLVTSGGISHLPVYERQGIVYFSINHFEDASAK